MWLLRLQTSQLIPTLLTLSLPAFREPSLAPLAMRFVPWTIRLLVALAEKGEAPMAAILIPPASLGPASRVLVVSMAREAPSSSRKQLSQGTPTQNLSTMGLLE